MFQMISYISPEVAAAENVSEGVNLRCDCNKAAITCVPSNHFKQITADYCVLADSASVTCALCGQSADSNTVFRLENQQSGYKFSLPQCPKCHSINVNKITMPQRVILYATLSKFLSSYECQQCFYKW